MVNCCVCFGCTNTSYSGHRMHSFPDRHKSAPAFRAWVRFVKAKRKDFSATSVSAHSMICEAHFTQEDYLPGDRMEMKMGFKSRNQMRLNEGAVPSVHTACVPARSATAAKTKKRSTSAITKRWLFSTLSEGNATYTREAETRSSLPQPVAQCNIRSDCQSSGKKDNPPSPDCIPSVFNHVPSPVSKRGNMLMDTFSTKQVAKKRRLQQEITEATMGSHTPAAGPSSITNNTQPQQASQPSTGHLFIIDYIETKQDFQPFAEQLFIIDYTTTEKDSQLSAGPSSVNDYTTPEKDSQLSAGPSAITDYNKLEQDPQPSAGPSSVSDYIKLEKDSQPSAGPSSVSDFTTPIKDSQSSVGPLSVTNYIKPEQDSQPFVGASSVTDCVKPEQDSQPFVGPSSVTDYIKPEQDSQPSAGPSSVTDYIKPEQDSPPLGEYEDIGPTCDNDNCKTHFQSLKLEIQALKAENQLLKDKMSKNELNESALRNSDKHVVMLTGLPTFSILMALFHVVSPYLKMNSSLTLFQQFVLTLIKLRMNLSFDFLAFYFGVNSSTVTEVFKHCISVMYCRLVPSLIFWPEREILRKTLPNAFRNELFEKTVCIIDCFEILIEKPSNPLPSTQSYFTSRSHHTMKYLIAVSPQGSICFISNGWGGRTSDKFITENSNFLSHLLPGDLVLADKCFKGRQSVQSFQADTKILTFTCGKKQLDPVDLENTQSLASLRIHIESVIGVVRHKYTILQSTVPTAFTDVDGENDVMYLDKIVKICCALTNVCESVIPTS